ncbi:MAG TPA: hypothetical protein PKK43_01620 [Spirochaetota bacterium]|nr:hypothetical protein [Spirochaetota bacterium]
MSRTQPSLSAICFVFYGDRSIPDAAPPFRVIEWRVWPQILY